jgi:hypothetical protein
MCDAVKRRSIRLELERDLAEELFALKTEVEFLGRACVALRYRWPTGLEAGHAVDSIRTPPPSR